jgi:hypothetical protein
MKSEISLLYSQESATDVYTESDKPSPKPISINSKFSITLSSKPRFS